MNLLLGGEWDDGHSFTWLLVPEGLKVMEAHTQGFLGHSSEILPQGSCRIHGLLAWLKCQRQVWTEREGTAARSSLVF